MELPPKKKPALSVIILILGLGVLITQLPRCDFGPDRYDTMRGFPFMKKYPPYIPGTEGQKEVKIQVLDATTLEPIEGAIVVGGYYGRGASGGVACAKSESAISDAEGWATLPNDQDPRVRENNNRLRGPQPESAYKRGYQLAYPLRYASSEGAIKWFRHWYVKEMRPAPRVRPSERGAISPPQKFFRKHKSALMETKERSRIYLMLSTAETKEERMEELHRMRPSCSWYPFSWSPSKGALAMEKAIFQELVDTGYYDGREDLHKRAEKDMGRYENTLKGIRHDAVKGK